MLQGRPTFLGQGLFYIREKVMLVSLKGLRKPVSLLSLVATLGVALTASQAQAGLVSSNLDTTFTGETLAPVAGFPMKSVTVYNASNPSIVDFTLGNCVFQDTKVGDADYGQYIYEEKLTTGAGMAGSNGLGAFSSLTTEFAVLGFTAGVSKVGWSYSAASGVNATATDTSADFHITDEVDGSLNFVSLLDGNGWTTGTSLTFFYESTDGPGTGNYEIQDDINATAQSYAPVAVPVPAAASMGFVALAGLAGIGLLKRRQAAL